MNASEALYSTRLRERNHATLTVPPARGDNAVMAQIHQPPEVKLICGMISSQARMFDLAMGPLSDAFGPADLVSEVMDFDFTHYYDAEMAWPLYRKFVSFARVVRADVLVQAKLRTNAIEADLAGAAGGGPPRPINLDPGYIEASKLVLASMKNFSHRIYMGQGVYAEITLMYRKGRWKPLPWTFPDYASPRYHAFLTEARMRLRVEET